MGTERDAEELALWGFFWCVLPKSNKLDDDLRWNMKSSNAVWLSDMCTHTLGFVSKDLQEKARLCKCACVYQIDILINKKLCYQYHNRAIHSHWPKKKKKQFFDHKKVMYWKGTILC